MTPTKCPKSRLTRSGMWCVGTPGMVVTGVNIRGEIPSNPCRRIEAATVFTLTSMPAAWRSAVIRGAPYTCSEAVKKPRTCSSSSAYRAACGPGPASRCLAQR